MTTAQTPSEKVQRLAITLEIVGAVPDMNYVTVPRHVARDASVELRRLQADNERLQGSLDAQRLISDRAIALAKELEARKPLPLSYRSGVMTSSIDGGATVSLHFNDLAEAEAWFLRRTPMAVGMFS